MGLTKPRAAQIFNLDYKQSTRVVTATNITLTGGAPNLVDGVTLSLGDRVLVTGQSAGSQNGLYYVTTLGSGSNGTWARTSDGNENGEIEAGMIVMVTEGVIYADTQWKLITDDPIVIGTTALTFTQNYLANSISSGTSNVVVNSNANVTISSAGTANVVSVGNTAVTFTGNLFPSANVTYTLGNTTNRWKDIWLSNSSIYLGNIVLAATATALTVDGVPVVTSTANAISVTGNITGGNLITAGIVSATGNVTGNYILGNIACASGIFTTKIFNGTSEANIGTSGGNANISVGGVSNVVVFATTGEFITGLLSVTGNITGGNISATNHTGTNVSVTGTVTSASVVGGVITGTSTSVSGGVTANSVSATSNGAGTNFRVGDDVWIGDINIADTMSIRGQQSALNGYIVFGNADSTALGRAGSGPLTYGGAFSASGNVTGGNISATNYTGTTVSVSGNVAGANIVATTALTNGNITITGANIVSSGQTLTIDPNGSGGTDGNVIITGNLSVQGNITYINSNNITTNDLTINVANNAATAAAANGGGIGVGPAGSEYISLTYSSSSNVWVASNGLNVQGVTSASGNVTAGNVLTGGLISATGNITGGNILGNGAGLTGINAFSNVTVTGGNSAVADSIADTLTLTAGTGIAIVVDSATDTITIAASGGSEIFVDGADFGTVTEPVTLSDDLGLVTDAVTAESDLGLLVTSGLIYPDQFVLPSYTTSTLPSASVAGAMIYVTNETGGPVPAFADGTNWRRVTDRAIVT